MSFYLPGPQLIGVLVAIVSGLVSWGFWRHRKSHHNYNKIVWIDSILISFVVFAILIMTIFWTSFMFRIVP
jgi:hypothetical protein